MKKCRKTGKTKLKTKKLADKVKIRIWSHDPQADIFDLHSYLCESCGMWHVGHKSYYEMSKMKKTPIEITDSVTILVD